MIETQTPSRDLASRSQVALDRIHTLVSTCDERGKRAWRNHYRLQVASIGLAAITPCLIILAKESPNNVVFNWLQLFFPAIAAICVGASHIFRWREDGVRYTSLAESIRSQLWRYQTRTGEYPATLSDDQALDVLVTHVDELNLKSVANWSATQLASAEATTDTSKTS